MRKDIHSLRQWNTSRDHSYKSSAINTWLNDDFYNSLGFAEKTFIKQVKIPYIIPTTNLMSGSNGLSCKIFLLSGYEVGWTTNNHTAFMSEGAKLNYFGSGAAISDNKKRVAYLNGSATKWGLRSPNTDDSDNEIIIFVRDNGNYNFGYGDQVVGIRPALILSSTAKFDKDTKILKG